MKAIMKLVFVLIMTLNYAQNNEKKENIKIGDYKYEIFLQDGWNYERNLNYINFITIVTSKVTTIAAKSILKFVSDFSNLEFNSDFKF